jgi:hypothetical protein
MITPQELQAARATKRAADLQRQAESRTTYKAWTIQLAIGSTGGALNVGVEASRTGECDRYFSNLGEAEAWIDKRPVK